MSEIVLSRLFPHDADSPPLFDLTVVDRQPQGDGWDLVTFQRPDGTTFSGPMKWFPQVPPADDLARRDA